MSIPYPEPIMPAPYQVLWEETQKSGFTMASDLLTGSLLKTLAASKPAGLFLELGTGTGLSTSWILDGMDSESQLYSIDNDPKFLDLANKYLGKDRRLQLELSDGEAWILANKHRRFDFIFADTWHGKFLLLEETLVMLNPGGIYFLDDLLPQANWPEGHAQKVENVLKELYKRKDLCLSFLNWSTGILIGVKN